MEQPIYIKGNIKPKEFWVDQSHINGLLALMNWLDGYEAAGKGNISGHHELIMHWRILRSSIQKELE